MSTYRYYHTTDAIAAWWRYQIDYGQAADQMRQPARASIFRSTDGVTFRCVEEVQGGVRAVIWRVRFRDNEGRAVIRFRDGARGHVQLV
jgi:hypothetical protein